MESLPTLGSAGSEKRVVDDNACEEGGKFDGQCGGILLALLVIEKGRGSGLHDCFLGGMREDKGSATCIWGE